MSLIGMQLGHYTLTRLIGSGGMGEVYLAEDIRTHRQVAIKILRGELSAFSETHSTQEAERLFRREMSIIISLDHPHILPLYDYGEEVMHKTTLTYMVMPYRQEGSLDDWLQRRGDNLPLSPQDAAFLVQQAGEALQCAHDHNIIHQDVKTSNFLIWEVKERPNRPDLLLADFGIAKTLSATSSSSQSVRGTPAYMPPEQWDGRPVYASDQYALAVMAYLLLTGHRPFSGRPEQVMRQHYFTTPERPSTRNPRLSSAIDAVILRALEKSPTDRYPSISAFVSAFQQAILDEPVPSVPSVRSMPNLPTPPTPTGGDLHATLTITPAEAFTGSMRSLKLPGGRFISVQVPPGAHDHQIIRLDGVGEPQYPGGLTGAVIITLAVAPAKREDTPNISNPGNISRPVSSSGNQNKQPGMLNATVSDLHNDPTVISKPHLFPTPTPEAPPTSFRSNRRIAVIALAIVAIIIILSSGTIFAVNTINTNNAHNANATSTANSNASNTHVNATNTAHANNTAIANNNATSTAIAGVRATGTVIAQNANPYLPGKGTLVLNDSLHQNSNAQWTISSDNTSACQFTQNSYQVTDFTTPNDIFACNAIAQKYSNFTFEVNMKITQGSCGGINFRDDGTGNHDYIFEVCQDGSYNLSAYTSLNNSTPLAGSTSQAIHQGTGQTNQIAIVANGSNIIAFVNHQSVLNIQNRAYTTGFIGLVASTNTTTTTVQYTNARVWKL